MASVKPCQQYPLIIAPWAIMRVEVRLRSRGKKDTIHSAEWNSNWFDNEQNLFIFKNRFIHMGTMKRNSSTHTCTTRSTHLLLFRSLHLWVTSLNFSSSATKIWFHNFFLFINDRDDHIRFWFILCIDFHVMLLCARWFKNIFLKSKQWSKLIVCVQCVCMNEWVECTESMWGVCRDDLFIKIIFLLVFLFRDAFGMENDAVQCTHTQRWIER